MAAVDEFMLGDEFDDSDDLAAKPDSDSDFNVDGNDDPDSTSDTGKGQRLQVSKQHNITLNLAGCALCAYCLRFGFTSAPVVFVQLCLIGWLFGCCLCHVVVGWLFT